MQERPVVADCGLGNTKVQGHFAVPKNLRSRQIVFVSPGDLNGVRNMFTPCAGL